MIISCYAKKNGIAFSEATSRLLSANCFDYLEEYYETLHLLPNEDVVSELLDMAGTEVKK